MNRKAQQISMNMTIIVALSLLVLVICFIFIARTNMFMFTREGRFEDWKPPKTTETVNVPEDGDIITWDINDTCRCVCIGVHDGK